MALKKLRKLKKNLKNQDYFFQKRVGLNQPNRLYLLKPEATAQDVYLQVDNSSEPPSSLGNKGLSKIEINQYKEILNTDTYKDTVKDTGKKDLQNRELLQSFSTTQDQSFLDKRCLDLIALFSTSIQEASDTVGIIIRAKNKQEKKYDRTLVAEDWREEIETTLRKVYHKIKTDHKIKNRDNYMFGAFCTTFENCILQMIAWTSEEEKDLPVISMHNWLEQNENN